MIGQNPRGASAYSRTTAPMPRMPETPLYEKIRSYRLHPLGQEAYNAAIAQLRNQLRSAELRPDIFLDLQQNIRQLLESETSLQMEPVARVRDLVQGTMTAFTEKKMLEAEGARLLAVSVILFFPRGVMEQLDVAKSVACELMMTKVNLGTEMVQMSFGLGQAFPLLAGFAYLAPQFLNKDRDYLEALYKKIHEGIWTGTMLAARNSTAHGQANVEKFEMGCEQYTQEWVARLAAEKTKSVFSKLPFGWKS